MKNLSLKHVFIAALLLSPSLVSAATPREQIAELFSSYEPRYTRADLLAISPDAETIIADLLTDQNTWLFVRTRALGALALFPTEQNLTRTLAQLQQENPLLRQYAAATLGRTWAKTFADRVLPALQNALADQDVMVRRYAVRSLALVGSEPARNALRARLTVEPHADVARLISKQLTTTQLDPH